MSRSNAINYSDWANEHPVATEDFGEPIIDITVRDGILWILLKSGRVEMRRVESMASPEA